MDKHAVWKWLILIFLTACSLALVYPPATKIRLGLDLQGGTSYTLEINAAEIEKLLRDENPDLPPDQIAAQIPRRVKQAQDQALLVIRNRVDALGLAEPLIYPEKDDRIVVQIPGLKEEHRERAKSMIQSAAYLEFAMVHKDNDKLVGALFEKGVAPEGYRIVSLQRGQRKGEFYQRDAKVSETTVNDAAFRERLKSFHAPKGYRFLLEEKTEEHQKVYVPYFVSVRSELNGDHLKTAGYEFDPMGRPYVTLKFDGVGARKFYNITAKYAPGGDENPNAAANVLRYMAIILDGRLFSAPYLKEPIRGGEAQITGSFTLPEAQSLAIVLRAGSLPVPVTIIEEHTVSASLGKDSVESGTWATLYSCLLVVVFMAGYYWFGGVVANTGLLFNLLLLPLSMWVTAGIMALFSGDAIGSAGSLDLPVLTLPGIAGIALTLGMAVDANVLIFERIREEQNQGKRFGPAVEAGYDKAFVTILDSNLTTIMSALILFYFGTGAVKGFGVTLTAGILASMYTALVVTRMLLNLAVKRGTMPLLKMMNLIKPTRIDFIKWRRAAGLVSAVVIIGSWAALTVKGLRDPASVLGTDFTGGAATVFSFTQKQDVETIRAALESAGIRDAQIQYQQDMDRHAERLHVRTAQGTGDAVKRAIEERFATAGAKLLSEDVVGPQIGGEMTLKAVKALILALIGMVLYISVRFQFAYAVGAIAALAHDVLVSAGVYCLFGRQINMTIIAALLTIIGFSVNDTIVIFDRIREKLKLTPTRNFLEVCNLAINETLGRTILTSFTVFMAVVMLLLFGGGAINDFAFIFFIGILTGTYSTVYIATPVMMLLRREKKPAATVGGGGKGQK